MILNMKSTPKIFQNVIIKVFSTKKLQNNWFNSTFTLQKFAPSLQITTGFELLLYRIN